MSENVSRTQTRLETWGRVEGRNDAWGLESGQGDYLPQWGGCSGALSCPRVASALREDIRNNTLIYMLQQYKRKLQHIMTTDGVVTVSRCKVMLARKN